jgi:hypothetical protein
MSPKTADFIAEQQSVKEPSKEPSKRKAHPNSLKNLRPPWPKGFCPNPGGKNGRDAAAMLARAVIEGNLDAAYKGLSMQLNKGNAYTFKELAERGYGKLKEIHQVEHIHQDVPDEDLQKQIDDIIHKLGLARAIDRASTAGNAVGGTSPANGKAKDTPVLP